MCRKHAYIDYCLMQVQETFLYKDHCPVTSAGTHWPGVHAFPACRPIASAGKFPPQGPPPKMWLEISNTLWLKKSALWLPKSNNRANLATSNLFLNCLECVPLMYMCVVMLCLCSRCSPRAVWWYYSQWPVAVHCVLMMERSLAKESEIATVSLLLLLLRITTHY